MYVKGKFEEKKLHNFYNSKNLEITHLIEVENAV